MYSSWYLTGANGLRFCWNKEPTFICPHSRSLWDCTDLTTGEVTTVEREPGERMGITFTRHVSDAVRDAATVLAMDPELLASMVMRAHRSSYGRRRIDGRLTDRCKVCGAKMERLGFRCWIERDPTDEERSTSDRISERIGGQPSRIVRHFHVDTKAKAERWARREVELTKAGKESDR